MRRIVAYACAAALFIMLGLASRRGDEFPGWMADHAGDALWAGMIYWGCRLCWPRSKPRLAAAGSSILCVAVECSQLYQAEWINAIRATVLGALVLGHGFLGIDLIRYGAGIAAAWGMDCALLAIIGRMKRMSE
ncbi:DUF2809 domain-containing protein [Paenibacillus montanisoli]|uniref:DUF2809 domain-containing protein n=1 Tax=Paenibacillus montanisoli TaxID=2081970 RepID=A0A328U7T3_9BACL|nr:DUF2809 domain-containing protein [Paenibacillus montanisoli]RAP76164.1 DUF2809 domain-containing protein [Paenibacillus montanisoli]